jgi:hypothetical protein
MFQKSFHSTVNDGFQVYCRVSDIVIYIPYCMIEGIVVYNKILIGSTNGSRKQAYMDVVL